MVDVLPPDLRERGREIVVAVREPEAALPEGEGVDVAPSVVGDRVRREERREPVEMVAGGFREEILR